jgi:hypothetical protein
MDFLPFDSPSFVLVVNHETGEFFGMEDCSVVDIRFVPSDLLMKIVGTNPPKEEVIAIAKEFGYQPQFDPTLIQDENS